LAALTALGIVFGDIGTSPLYAMQTVLEDSGKSVRPEELLGVLSLIAWTVILIVGVKYCLLVMRADNDSEGGVLALTALVVGAKKDDEKAKTSAYRRLWRSSAQKILLSAGLFGGALLFGDSVLTPSISVLSAMEGLKVAAPSSQVLVLPGALLILVLLFVSQRMGTARLGGLFGPFMLVWFMAIGGLGFLSCLHHPEVLRAINPAYAAGFLIEHGRGSLILLGGVFLTVTGAEALYADMGSVGRMPVRVAWFAIVLPSLLLCYAGQAAALIGQTSLPSNPFYAIVPSSWGTVPIWIMVGLATCATIIASQAVITGVFSIAQQAMQLGWFPGIRIEHTSAKEHTQIYVPLLNWSIMIATITLTAVFGSSARLAGAYGMAVSATMLLTTVLYGAYLRRRMRWSWAATGALLFVLLTIDISFFCANIIKISDGGYIPLIIAIGLYIVMSSWRRGVLALRETSLRDAVDPEVLTDDLQKNDIPRTPGHVVFLSHTDEPIPPVIGMHVRQFGGLPRHAISLSVLFVHEAPRVPPGKRLTHRVFEGVVEHVTVRYGFMETPALLDALAAAAEHGVNISPDEALFIAEHDEVVASAEASPFSGLRRWERPFFAFLYRNARRPLDRFHIPAERVVEIGRRVAL